jgi:uncharacterized protein (TIGR02302 family)
LAERRRPKLFARRSAPGPAPQPAAFDPLRRLVARAGLALAWERIWRTAVPPLAVLALFLCVSWAGLWLQIGHLAREIGVACFALILLASLVPLLRLRWPSRTEALARIDGASNRPHRPAATLDDSLANEGRDPATRALWELHRRRAAALVPTLRAGLPSPRMVDVDRYALRAGVLVALVACAILAGPEKYARLAAAFDWQAAAGTGATARIDAWLDPPAYTGKPPLLLHLVAGADPTRPTRIDMPAGSTLVVRSTGTAVALETKGGLAPPAPAKPAAGAPPAQPAPLAASDSAAPASGETEQKRVLSADASLVIRADGSVRGAYRLVAIPDKPPTIALADVPRSNVRGSLTLGYTIADDYGVIGAEATVARPMVNGRRLSSRSLVEAPRIALSLPLGPGGLGDAETTTDLSEHPWAGARVELTLSARDEGGNEGRSEPVEITLPQKVFTKPVARALVEQRRNLVLAPDARVPIETALEALMIAPEVFDTSTAVYLGLRVADDRLKAARGDADLLGVADYLWEMALRIENGDLSDAERQLRDAERHLRDALQRNASEDEIRKLTDELRAAMDKFLNEMAQQQMRDQNGQRDAERTPSPRDRMITQRDLQAMMDRLQDMARSGDRAEAQRALEQLQNILENLRTAKRRNGDPRARDMQQALNDLDRMTREQQDLRDETYKRNQDARRQRRERQNGMRDPNGDPDQGDDEQAENGDQQGGQGGMGDQELRDRQQALRRRLEQLQRRMKGAGQGNTPLDDAEGAMQDAEGALGQGQPGRGRAVDAQGRALDALRRGAQQLAQQMQQGGGDPSDQADDDDGDDDGSHGSPRRGDGRMGADPLGRPTASDPTFNPRSRYDPLGVPAAQRAQQVLEELRRRLSDPTRPREETDYLERLLKRY